MVIDAERDEVVYDEKDMSIEDWRIWFKIWVPLCQRHGR